MNTAFRNAGAELLPVGSDSVRAGEAAISGPNPARVALILFGIVLLGIVSSWEHTMGNAPFGSLTEPVSVEIRGLDASDREQVQVTFLPMHKPETSPLALEEIPSRRSGFSWHIPARGVIELHITATSGVLRRMQAVEVVIGGSRETFDRRRFFESWRPVAPLVPALDGPDGTEKTLAWPNESVDRGILNWRSHRDILISTGRRSMVIIGVGWSVVLLLVWIMKRPGMEAGDTAGGHVERQALWLAAGFGVFCAGAAVTLSGQSYAFTQDDNFSQFLPVVVRSANELFQGRFPVWNPYQLMGSPTATVGTYVLTYPPTYLSYGIARFVFGDPYLTIDIFTVLHLAAGYFVTFFLLRRVDLRPSLAAAGAVSFSLCAFFLIGGRSQFTFIPAAVWVPLLMRCALALERGARGWKWALATGAVVGVYFHAGHAQLWIYAVMFFVAAVVLLAVSGRVAWRQALWTAPALCFGVALAAPLLFLQMAELKGRHFGSIGVGVNLLGMLVPLGRWAPDLRLPGIQPESSGQLPYFGTVFAAASLIGLIYYLRTLALCRTSWSKARILLGEAVWLLLTLAATLMVLGPDGLLWPLMAQIPPFQDFRWPIKLMPFVVLFACMGGGQFLDRWCRRQRIRWAPCLALAAMGLMLINCSWARASWYQFADRPYPSLDAAYADLIESRSGNVAGRILTRPTWEARSPAPGLFRTQILNFPTITGALSVGGYDTFVETSAPNRLALERLERDPAGAARAYGVRWLIWDRIFERPVFSMNPFWATLEQPTVLERKILFDVRAASSLALNVDGLKVYRLPDADPMAFLAGSEKRPLTVNLDMRGATVDTAGIAPGSEIVVNLLWRPWLRAFSDGRPALIHSDEWGRVVAQVGGATRRMTVSYRPPWAVSSFAGLAIAGIGAAFGWVLRRLTA